ncbi:hypothetical protein FRB94_007154 [Tulasnella sp. JGI-2019a]|nr:hypothetical protein FRB93_012474 [Tulasnella sp. JGI-2019a]KAG9011961.1 hypothetical protein FRB94_007154 [Tulasnella sp. JGI-2019a]KAG9036266.1 hypothetical protein FRB95_009414 [Tulasnella sp. JGI-2019a]
MTTASESQDNRVEPTTSSTFPTSVRFKSPESAHLSILGLGAYSVGVSFVKIHAFSVGFYADVQPDLHPDFYELGPNHRLDWLIMNRTVAVRLVPTSFSTFQRLQAEFVKALEAALAQARKPARTKEEEENILTTIRQLKSMTPSPTLQSKTPFYLISSPEFESRTLDIPSVDGDIRRIWVDVEFVQNFIRDGAPPSMKRSAYEGLQCLQPQVPLGRQ